MKAFYCEGRDKGAGLSDKLCFTLVKRLLAHNERRSRNAEDSMRVLESIAIHRLRAKDATGYCLVVNDEAVLNNTTGPEWDSVLAQCGAVSRATIPTAFQPEPFCHGTDLYRMVGPVPSDGGEVHHVMLESREGRLASLVEEVMQVEDARSAVVTLDCGDRGLMTCVLVEFAKGGHVGASLESLFPSAEVIRVSDTSQRLVFSHLGTTCRWMFSAGNEVVLMPVRSREDSGQSKVLVTFTDAEGALEPVLCSWRREDESGLGSFIRLSFNAPSRPLLATPVAELASREPVELSVMLTRDGRLPQDDRRLYLIDEASPSFPKVLSRIVDASEFAAQGAVSYARWEGSEKAVTYAFLSPLIREFECYRDVRSYRILDAHLGLRGLAVREGYRFVPEMPEDEGWIAALSDVLFASVGAGDTAWAVVDPHGMSDSGMASLTAVVIPAFFPLDGYRRNLEVFGPVLRASLVADEKSRHQEFSSRSESAWQMAAHAEKANSEIYAEKLFDELKKDAETLDRSLQAMRDDVRSTKEMAEPLHDEAKLTRKDLQSMTDAFAKAIKSSADKSANWAELQRRFNEHVRLLEAAVRMLDGGVRLKATTELERVTNQNAEITQRLASLRQAEADVIQAHLRSSQLAASLEQESHRVQAEIETRERAIADDCSQVAEFDILVEKVSSLAAVEHALALETMKLRHAEAQCVIREQAAKAELGKLDNLERSLVARQQRIQSEVAGITHKRASVSAGLAQVRTAGADRDKLQKALESEERTLANMIKLGDPRIAAQQLIAKAKALRNEIEEVEEGRKLLADGDVILADLEAKLNAMLDGHSLADLRKKVAATQKDIDALEKATRSLEDALAAQAGLAVGLPTDERQATWERYRQHAMEVLKFARAIYLRSRNPLNPPLADEINAAIEALRQLLP